MRLFVITRSTDWTREMLRDSFLSLSHWLTGQSPDKKFNKVLFVAKTAVGCKYDYHCKIIQKTSRSVITIMVHKVSEMSQWSVATRHHSCNNSHTAE